MHARFYVATYQHARGCKVALTYQGRAFHFRQREERALMSHAMRRVVRYGSANMVIILAWSAERGRGGGVA